MPLAMTETRLPWYNPVYPCTPRTSLTSRASVSRRCAMNRERSGSPGIRTVGAKSPGMAPIWGVGT